MYFELIVDIIYVYKLVLSRQIIQFFLGAIDIMPKMFKYCISLWLVAVVVQKVRGHGNMVMPPTWWDKEGIAMMEGLQCASGFSINDLPAGP